MIKHCKTGCKVVAIKARNKSHSLAFIAINSTFSIHTKTITVQEVYWTIN